MELLDKRNDENNVKNTKPKRKYKDLINSIQNEKKQDKENKNKNKNKTVKIDGLGGGKFEKLEKI